MPSSLSPWYQWPTPTILPTTLMRVARASCRSRSGLRYIKPTGTGGRGLRLVCLQVACSFRSLSFFELLVSLLEKRHQVSVDIDNAALSVREHGVITAVVALHYAL